MLPEPLYRSEGLRAAYQLRYGWTGWPSRSSWPVELIAELVPGIATEWEGDGIRVLESALAPERIQLTVSTTPHVSPVLLAARVKGRLQHHARLQGTPLDFSRKVALRSLGDPTRAQVEEYIRGQVRNEDLADERFRAMLAAGTVIDRAVDLAQPTRTHSGQYWYNLHLVLVVRDRYRFGDAAVLSKVRDLVRRICTRKGYAVSALAVMADHLHVALRGDVDHSPEQIALAFLNNLAYAFGQQAWWESGYYAGTFGEYGMAAVRAKSSSGSPPSANLPSR